jgi:hypothetical protein
MNAQAARLASFLVATLLTVGACGGSSGGGGVTAQPPPPPPPPPPVGGITRTGVAVAVGPVTAFGSVVVNGITYDTSAADFTVDGQAATQANLAVGDMVLVIGTIDDDNTNAVAESVESDDIVEGPVSSVNTGTEIMVVLGQTVKFGGAIFDDNCPAILNDLLTVAAVEVHGQVMGDGTIDATRIECKNVLLEMEVTGIVSGLGVDTFMINDLVVNFTSFPAAIDNFPTPGVISDGNPVEVKGNSFVAGTDDLIATRVEFKGNRFGDNEGDHMEIEGFINGFVSELEFNVGITPVTTIPDTTIYEGGSVADLGDNLKVEVEGEFDDAGVLNATKVEIKQATTVRLTAQVDSVSGNSFVMLGITVNTEQGKTRFEDKTGMVGDSFNIGDINTDDYVEVRGQEIPAGSGQVFAEIVERDDFDTEAIIQGFIETNGVNRPLITVLGDTIETNGATIFRNDDESVIADSDEFWGRIAAGSLIKAKGTEDMARPRTLIAEEIEIQVE